MPALHRLPLLLIAIVALIAPAAEEAGPAPAEATLTVWNRPIAVLRAELLGAAPAARAARAAGRIAALADDELGAPVGVRLVTSQGLECALLVAGDQPLFALSAGDLDPEAGVGLAAAAEAAAGRLREALAARAEQGRPAILLRGALVAALASLAAAAALAVLWRLRRWLLRHLHARVVDRLPVVLGVDTRPLGRGALRLGVRLPLLAATLAILYLWLVAVLGQFPFTRPWSRSLGRWLLDLALQAGEAVVGALPGLAVVALVVLLTRLATRSLNAFFSAVEERRLEILWLQPETAKASRRVVIVLVWLFAITVAYPYLPGSSSDAFKGVSVFAGLMLTLGSAGLVNQVMSGLVVVYSRSMRPGDLVQVGEVVGTVTDLGFLSTKVRTPREEEVTLPNAVVVGATVTNFSRFDAAAGMVLATQVTIGYDTPWRQVHALLRLAAERTPGLRRDQEPEVVQKALDDWYVAYELRVRLERAETRFAALSALHAQIQDAFNEHGVQIMSPHFVAQPAQAVVVPRAGWAPPPAASG